jgi:mevalonate kinase
MSSQTCTKAEVERQVGLATASSDTAFADAYAAKANVEIADDHLKKLQTALETAQQFTSKSIDPPIATIGQSIQFILAYGGNITPTWTFVRFKGPNNPLFSSSSTRTHTLNVTLGPVVPGTNTPNSDVKTNQFYLQINSLVAPLIP